MGLTRRPHPQALARKLRQIRINLHLSQGQIARKLNVANRETISGYERGEREPPLPILLSYARLAGTSTDVLIDDSLELPAIRCKRLAQG